MRSGLQKAGQKAVPQSLRKLGHASPVPVLELVRDAPRGLVGCAAGALYFVADMAFTIFSTIMDLTDKEGLLVLLNKAYIDELTEDFHEMYEAGLKDAFDQSAVPDSEDKALEYMNEEKTFDPSIFFLITTNNKGIRNQHRMGDAVRRARRRIHEEHRHHRRLARAHGKCGSNRG